LEKLEIMAVAAFNFHGVFFVRKTALAEQLTAFFTVVFLQVHISMMVAIVGLRQNTGTFVTS